MSNKIIIKTKQYDADGNMDTIELKAYGQVIEKNGSIYIKYNQKEEDMEVKNTIKISEDCIKVIKTGSVNSTMTFTKGNKHTNKYATPQGIFLIDTKVNDFKISNGEKKLEVHLDYMIEIQNMFAGRNKMIIKVEK
ncbi:DUF1934 domain-containing protein [Peptacetobacter hiranonis]|uniref:DUF1934 domain-containing protein n=1 Tax=Peptacetobacter hiranonis (strain DSM 13275 / JCM 10541 / KCTC 15199 / TO-931) TaxID=500633 RepID=B6G0G3_PEPHT|nr:DUF1934 domain-containing protein [Peptacetobacter hiranonis]EEA84773.1 hypothetical protein CLOHIR_01619 [Peptacetobacter hiranonis DSM 13275]QEK19624.1 hypothetical protein KGNDJEFE_00008 [Peptacetobacter hiranonis]